MQRNKLLLLLALLLTAVTGAWAANTVTWTAQNQLPTLEGKTTATIDGVTITTPSAITVSSGRATFNGATFSVTEGNITKIVLKSVSGVSGYPAGWTISNNTEATWTGSAKSVSCGYSGGVYSIEFTIETVYTVTMAEGTKDAKNWSIASGEKSAKGDAADGLTGLKEKDAVTLTYNGRLKVKGVTATSDAAEATVPVETITLNKTATSIKVGATETLSVTAVAPDNATDKTYTWKTSDESKATVDQDGKVTAVAAGTVTIYAEANDGSGVKGNCTVTVTPATITVTWNASAITGYRSNPITIEGVTLTAGNIQDWNMPMIKGGGTFTTTLGNFTKIELNADWITDFSGTGWVKNGWQSQTWTGDAASVSYSGTIGGGGMTCDGGSMTIVFTIE